MNIGWMMWKYNFVRSFMYVVAWIFTLLALVVITWLSPKTALWLLKQVEPISVWFADIFWLFVPESGHFIRKAGQIVAWIGHAVAERMSEQNRVLMQLAVLNGLLLVSIVAWMANMVVMFFIKRAFVADFMQKYEVREREFDLPQTHFDRREPQIEWPKL